MCFVFLRGCCPRGAPFEGVRYKRHLIAKLALFFFFVSCRRRVHLCVLMFDFLLLVSWVTISLYTILTDIVCHHHQLSQARPWFYSTKTWALQAEVTWALARALVWLVEAVPVMVVCQPPPTPASLYQSSVWNRPLPVLAMISSPHPRTTRHQCCSSDV